MSRIGKKQIIIPDNVQVEVETDFLVVKGPKGELKQELHPKVSVLVSEGVLTVDVKNKEDKFERSLWGLFASLIINMIQGVTEGFEKKLEVTGVGYKAAVSGSNLILNVGFSHPVEFKIPEGVDVQTEGNNIIVIKGIDKQLVGEIAARIRRIKKTEPYKGTGIKYVGEQIRRKAGKTAAS